MYPQYLRFVSSIGAIWFPEREALVVNSFNAPLSVVILAAGEGTRMKSARPKPLIKLCGETMLGHILDVLDELAAIDRVIVVVGHKEEEIKEEIFETYKGPHEIVFVTQDDLRGTGDALSVAMTRVTDPMTELHGRRGGVLVLPGDVPLLDSDTLIELIETHFSANYAATLLSAELDEPYGYGRVVRSKSGDIQAVIEERDASASVRQISEINTSLYIFDSATVSPALRRISPDNAQGEYYLTDVIEVLASAGYSIGSCLAKDVTTVMGVNDRQQLSQVEKIMRDRINASWMKSGVTIVDPANTYVDRSVRIGTDTTLWPGVILSGSTVVGSGCEIGPATRLIDCVVGDSVQMPYVEARNAYIGEGVKVGPFVELLPGSKVILGSESDA